MKKILVVLLALGLIAAFGTTASAVDVKFSGGYYVVGVYQDNAAGMENSNSRALFYQRVRLQPVFSIAPGLTFTARMDALEKQWGQTDWRRGATAGSLDQTSSRPQALPAGYNSAIQENFEWERGYVTFKTGIGVFDVGYQSAATWGTVFADSGTTRPRIRYATAAGPLTLLAIYEKAFEADTSDIPGYMGKVDADADNYYLAAVYGFKGGSAGVLYGFLNNNAGRLAAAAARSKVQILYPYVKATFGPIYLEAEVNYLFGKVSEFEAAGTPDIDRRGWGAYLMAKVNMGPAFFGAQVGYSSGDDNAADTKNENGPGGGTDWNPALILMNDELATWAPGGATTGNSPKANIVLYNLFGGFKATPKLEIGAALTYATADKKTTAAQISKKYGTEFDVTATYKIYDNLSYMVGAGYLWTGDLFKGTNAAAKIDNDYLLMNKLSLSF